MRRVVVVAALLLGAVGFRGAAVAAAGAAAAGATDDELIKQGVESRRRQDDAGALDLFNKAYALRKSPRAAGQIGFADVALGRWVDAEARLEEALAAADDPWVKKNGGALRTSLEHVRGQLGDLDVLGEPAGAEIVIEGQVRGTLPLAKPMRVRAGECRFDVRAPGHTPVSRTVTIDPGSLTRETVNLSANVSPSLSPATETAPVKAGRGATATASASASGKPASSGAAASGAAVDTGVVSSPVDTRGGGSRLRTIGVVLVATGVVAAAGGLAFGLAARSAGESDSGAKVFDPDAASRGHTYQTLQWVGYGVGAALIAGGATAFLLGAPRTSDSQARSMTLVPLSGGGLAMLAGRF